MQSFIDSNFEIESSGTERVVFGKPIFNRISVSGSIPANVDFVVTNCRAMDDNENPTGTFNIIKVNLKFVTSFWYCFFSVLFFTKFYNFCSQLEQFLNNEILQQFLADFPQFLPNSQ